MPALTARFRNFLQHYELLVPILGLIAGVLSAGLIILFRFTINLGQKTFFSAPLEHYELLNLETQLLAPCIGFAFMAIFIHFFGGKHPRVGLAHVIDRLRHHQGYFPLRNIISQFVTGAVAVISGQSAGREGAAVHLGAGISSLLGKRISLNNQNMRTLVACGTAAAISASFNTPLAGVIFAMEVVLLEYTIAGFIPVMLASVAAAVMSQLAFGNSPAFHMPHFELISLWELPYMILMGAFLGFAAATAITLVKISAQATKSYTIYARFSIAALITCIGIYMTPHIMGQGYDTVDLAILGELTWQSLMIIALTKILVSSCVVGLGVPSGFIGPSLIMGACLGGVFGILGTDFAPTEHSFIGLYVVLGMAAMMGATLSAPLAALTAALEFTGSTHILLPAMLVIVSANIVCEKLFRQKAVFQTLLDTHGLNLASNSVSQWLENTPVVSLASTQFKSHDRHIKRNTAENFCNSSLEYILITDQSKPSALIQVSALSFHLRFNDDAEVSDDIDLLAIPAEKRDLAGISSEASLKDALDIFEKENTHALYLTNYSNLSENIYVSGILVRSHVEQYFQS